MVYMICLALVLLPLLYEYIQLRRCWLAVPVRVHIHGTRGKSSVVRLTAQLLREQGFRVLAKTTGDSPEYILPNGDILPIRRRGSARITEHRDILLLARRECATVIVVEGMALQWETVWMSEKILHATHAAIVNVRPDHAETMGSGSSGVADTLSLLLPQKGSLFLCDEKTESLVEKAKSTKTDYKLITASPLCQTSELAHALAADITKYASSLAQSAPASNVLPEKMSTPSPQISNSATAIPLIKFVHAGITVQFADLFSANDIRSTCLLCSCLPQLHNHDALRVALLSTRADRPLRTKAFTEMLASAGSPKFDVFLPVGNHAAYALLKKSFLSLRIPKSARLYSLLVLPFSSPARILKRLKAEACYQGKQEIFLVGMGNAHGQGEIWRRYFNHQELAC